jgi:hypothetical protein
MPIYLDTRGKSPLAVAICARCSIKFPRTELQYDPNFPGLLVCKDDLDVLDPWRLPARPSDQIVFDGPRPDVDLAGGALNGPIYQWANQIFGIGQWNAARPWQANAMYQPGDTVTPQSVDNAAVDLPQYWFLCLVGGTSAATPPVWPTKAGVMIGTIDFLTSDPPEIPLTSDTPVFIPLVADGNGDGTVSWMCLGIYPNSAEARLGSLP